MAGATPLRLGFGNKNHGTFKVEKFNLFDDIDLGRYAELRNRANDASTGVVIESMREHTRKTTEREGQGNDQRITTSEEVVLVIEYWEKTPKRKKGDNDVEIKKVTDG